MSDSTLAAPIRATGRKSSTQANAPKAFKKPTPPPVSPMPEGDRLVMEAAVMLQGFVTNILYDEADNLRGVGIRQAHEVKQLLENLLTPEASVLSQEDPESGSVKWHLAHISSKLEEVCDALECGLPGLETYPYVLASVFSTYAFDFAERLLIAYDGLPATLQDLRALTTQQGVYAGAKRYRDPPRPPMRTVEPEQTSYAPEMTDDTEFELTLLLDRADSVTSLLVQMFGTGIDTDALKLDGLNGALSNVRGCLSESLGLLDGISHIPEDLKTGLFEAHGLIETLSTIALASNGGWNMHDRIYSAYFDAASQCVDRAKDGLKLITKGAA